MDTGLVRCTRCLFAFQLLLVLIGRAELTSEAGYILRWFTRLELLIYPSTNWAWHQLTLLSSQRGK